MPGRKKYEDWQLIHWLKDFAEELGKSPTMNDCMADPFMPSVNVYKDRLCRNHRLVRPYKPETDSKFRIYSGDFVMISNSVSPVICRAIALEILKVLR